uniref:Predicted antitoxin, contains HTH domain n=1 Tax=Candidatus Kentrum sp. DK TaxID=2126562 RepID=A0A450TKL5_9GAMM|nr:MAG: Predicted antitoxin, contains HTH domain [Candidatus Kentron sp. DK]
MQIAIDLPNDFVAFQGEHDIRRDIRLSYALWLFQAERVTISKAAELAGMDIYDFMATCKASRIPVIDVDRSTLLAEMENRPV